MPKRWCLDCQQLFDMDTTGTQRCPACQAATDTKRNQRPPRQQRGYNADHDHARRQYLAQWTPGQPCAIGGEPLWDATKLDLAHNSDRTGWLGLACWNHNRATSKKT